jgi:Carboxypeptidase regulatory-like domain
MVSAYRTCLSIFPLTLAVMMLVAPALRAQSTNAHVTGLITDSSGAAVPEVSVKGLNTATNVEYPTVSNEAGIYVLPQLVPGPYKFTVTKPGFKTLIRSDVTLRIGDRLSLDFELSPGEIQTTIDVTSAAEILTTNDASYSTILDNSMITALPQLSRRTVDLTKVTPAVQGAGPATSGQGVGLYGKNWALAGGVRNGTLLTVDGTIAQDTETANVNRAIPTPDAVGEFRVQTGVLTADVGRYSGGVITISTQSGTNEYHGRLFYYGRNHDLNANSWQNNALGVEKQPFHQSNYGLAVGGPIYIPKLYKGKDKTFFFFAWEGERFSSSSLTQSSVPTEAERRGDFSQSIINFQNGQPVYARIFDMFGGYEDAQGNWIRPEFANATIPKERQVALAPFYLNLWPLPNHAPDANTSSTNNYHSFIQIRRPTDQQTGRLDHNFNEQHRMHMRVSHYRNNITNPGPFLHGWGFNQAYDNNWSGSLQYNWVPSPNSIVEVRLGTGIAKYILRERSAGADSSIDTDQWPFDPFLFTGGLRSDRNIPPPLTLPDYTPVGGQHENQFSQQLYNGSLSYSKIWGRHTLKTGYQHFWAISTDLGREMSGVIYLFQGGGSNQFWDRNDGLTGNPLAEIMLGSSSFQNWGNWRIAPYGGGQSAFVMDDWKVNSKLTVQLGLRYDREDGRKPRYPFGTIFDLDAKNVLTPNVGWGWSQVVATVPEVANYQQPTWLSQGVNGRVALTNSPEYPEKTLFDTDKGLFQPRVGVSYGLDSKTVLHGSFGLIYQGFTGLQTEYGGSFYYDTPTFTQVPTLDGRRWVSEIGLDHGLGTFPSLPGGGNLGWSPPVTTNPDYWNLTYGTTASPLGSCCAFSAPRQPYQSPYEVAWGFSVQRELAGSWVASAEYQGIRGVNLLTPSVFANFYTNLSPAYYSLGDRLQTPVPNPFFGQSQEFSGRPTVPLYQLLTAMPQYTKAGPGYLAVGRSMSHFANFQIQSRNFHGLSLLASYNIRKSIINNAGNSLRNRLSSSNISFQDPNDLNEQYSLAVYEYPQNLLLNYYYELPFGRGKRFMNSLQGWGGRIANAVAGGWGFAGVTNWWAKGTPVFGPPQGGTRSAPGAVVRWSVNGPNYKDSNVDYDSALVFQGAFVNPNPSGVFDRSAFVRTPDYGFGNIPFVFPNVRNPGGFSTDATLLKNFYLSENRQLYVNIRLEALNFFNHANMGSVDNDPDSPTFGGILGKVGEGRVMQIGVRVFF